MRVSLDNVSSSHLMQQVVSKVQLTALCLFYFLSSSIKEKREREVPVCWVCLLCLVSCFLVRCWANALKWTWNKQCDGNRVPLIANFIIPCELESASARQKAMNQAAREERERRTACKTIGHFERPVEKFISTRFFLFLFRFSLSAGLFVTCLCSLPSPPVCLTMSFSFCFTVNSFTSPFIIHSSE